jgi:outer membrane protein assembly factor BamB
LEFGGVARQMLREANRSLDAKQLEQISRRFFHTEAGYEGTYLLGTYYLDHSEPLAAALQFDRLRKQPEAARRWEPMLSLKSAICWGRAGLPEYSIQRLLELKAANEQGQIILGGKQITFFRHREDALEWLVGVLGDQQEFAALGEEEWTMFRGNASRNATSRRVSPVLDAQWSYPTIRNPNSVDPKQLEVVEAHLGKLEAENRKAGKLTLPAVHPLVIGETVVFRTFDNIRAVHLKTGALLWQHDETNPSSFDLMIEQGHRVPNSRNPLQQSLLEIFLTQRAWRDHTAGMLSSDGRFVFTLEDLGFLSPYYRLTQRRQSPLSPRAFNKLMAFELSSGKLQWQVGGSRGEYELELPGTFFLGPPLPLGAQLFCLAEVSGEIRLLVLDAKTGRLNWSQSLILPDHTLQAYPLRRLVGISPSFGDGVMICPTSAGAVVAVDLTRRMLRWGYRYPRNFRQNRSNRRALMIAMLPERSNRGLTDEEARWIDSVPTLVDGHVLLTPRDSDELHCLSLIDGSVKWKLPRNQGLYVAAVHDDKVVVVGRAKVRAFNLTDGKPAWKEPTPIPMPSGRGFRTGRLYCLPLSTGEQATLDLQTGRILARSKTQSGVIPGNLVAASGTIVSQSIDEVVGFRPLVSLRQQIEKSLQNSADDPAALALRGEILLHQGDEASGLADLRRSIEIEPHARARSVLAATLIEGLRFDFARYRNSSREIERLVDDPQQRSRFLRLYAGGLLKIGEHRLAFQEFLKLAGPETGEPRLKRISGSLTVRSDRWVRSRIAEIYKKASAEERAQLKPAVHRQLQAALSAETPDQLRKFLQYFADLPIADEVRRKLVEGLDVQKHPLELEFQLRQLRRSPDRETAAFSTARLALLLVHSQHSHELNELLEELDDQWADVVCLDGKTGRELVEGWRTDEQIAPLLSPEAMWPDRHLSAKRKVRRRSVQMSWPVNFVGPRGRGFQNWSLQLDNSRKNLIARDGNGTLMWKFAVRESGRNNVDVNNSGNYARAHGHLLLVVLGRRFVVLDTFGASPRLLWKRELNRFDRVPQWGRGRRGFRRFRPGRIRGLRSTTPRRAVGPMNDDFLCYQLGTTLFAAEPLTGNTLWERRNVARGSWIFGDNQHVFVVAPNSTQAMVLRGSDGEHVADRPVPAASSQLLATGSHVLSWTVTSENRRLALTDVLGGKTVWQKEFPVDARAIVVEGEDVAVFDPQRGRFVVLAVEDGRPHVDSEVEPTEGLNQIIVRRSQNRYVLLTHCRDKKRNNMGRFALVRNNYIRGFLPVHGYAYGFDRATGRELWKILIEQQAVDLSQPANLPVLVFNSLYPQRNSDGTPYEVVILDQRNGRIVYRNRSRQRTHPFALKVDREKQAIAVGFTGSTIAVTLTETPLSEPFGRDR